jgi:hypothetical protein
MTTKVSARNRYDIIFVSVMSALLLLFTVLLVCDPTGAQANVFFQKTGDFFADYFNVAKMSADRNPYWYGLDDPQPSEHGYPPLCYVIFYFLSRFADYAGLSAFDAGYTTMGLASAFLFMSVIALLFFAILRQGYRKQGALAALVPLALFFSSVFLFSFERGNIVLLAAALIAFFILNYRSENRVVAELALIALAVATALKGYPALVGLLLLFDRRYAAAARAALYAALLIFLPFLFFEGGFANISLWLRNIALNSAAYGSDVPVFGLGLFARIGALFGGDDTVTALMSVFNAADKVLCVVALIASFFQKIRWKQVMLLLCVLVCVQVNSARYLGLYLFIGIVLFFNVVRHDRWDRLYLALFIIILNPLQLVTSSGNDLTVLLMGVAVDILLVALTAQSVASGVQFVRSKIRPIDPGSAQWE